MKITLNENENANKNNGKTPTLCLNMIVKNESKIIVRLLESVLPIIDSYCICDTGSTDNTIEIIENFFKNKNIIGKIVYEPFKNFCYNRTFALKSCVGLSDYVLLLDADMILNVNNFNKNKLNQADSFTILQGHESFYYYNMRIIKNSGLYKYVGVTHEYIDCPENNHNISLNKDEIFIRDIGDGGSKHDKFERDIKLLSDGIKEEPNNARYYFYLGNSYHDIGRFEEAINVYKKRIEFGGWKEETWYSYYRIGLCYKNIGKIDQAIYYWLEGYNHYPERLEGLYEIIHYCRLESKHNMGNLFYQIAIKILEKNLKRDEYLFLHNDVYTYKLYYEYTIFSAYVGVSNINNEIVKVMNYCNDGGIIDNLLSNMKFYKDILKKIDVKTFDNSFPLSIKNEQINFTSSSSCLIQNNINNINSIDNKYCMNIRYVNYYINDQGRYLNCDNHIITINKYVELDENLNIINEKIMDLQYDGRLYVGVEDIKIFRDHYTNKLKYIGTGYHINNKIGIVSGNYGYNDGKLEVNELQQIFNNTGCEKNWIFVDYNNETHIIYGWHPLKICKLEENLLYITETKEMPNIFSRVRGSTCGFKYFNKIQENLNGNITIEIEEPELWFVTHIVSYEEPRHYYHMIVVFDSNMNLLRYSAPFKFEGESIEYCLSIVVENERVLINYSTWDRTTRIGIYDKKYIDSIVKYT